MARTLSATSLESSAGSTNPSSHLFPPFFPGAFQEGVEPLTTSSVLFVPTFPSSTLFPPFFPGTSNILRDETVTPTTLTATVA